MVAELPPVVVCRVCGCERLHVTHVRRTARGTIRYRRCPDCGAKYKTREVIEGSMRAAANPIAGLLDKAAEIAVRFLANTDEDGIEGGELFVRVHYRVPGVTAAGFAFRLLDDPRIVLGEDSRYRLKTPTA